MLFQYTDDNEYNALYGSKWWHLMYEAALYHVTWLLKIITNLQKAI